MKKQILLSASVVFSSMMFAQQAKLAKIPANLANRTAIRLNKTTEVPTTPGVATTTKSQNVPNKKISAFSEAIVGHTYYDLQSNSSVCDRIVVNADGTIATVWTMDANSGTSPAYAQRGTGYNYFNGTAWGAIPTVRVESQRTGWPQIYNSPSGKEVFLSHNTAASLLQVTTRATKGTGTWAESTTAIPTATTGGNWWPRLVGSGDTLHALSLTYPSAQGGAIYQGLDGAVVYSRSKDAGITWDITNVVPTGMTSATFKKFGGDSYAIACHGSTVAIVAGSEGQDLVMTKSTDGGNTWNSTTILKFPITNWDPATQTSDVNGDNVADTITTNDGTYAVTVAPDGKVYVFYGRMRILQTTPQTNGSYSYFPYTDGLLFWKEAFGTDTGGVVITGALDLNNNGTLDLPTPANTGDLPFGTFGNSISSMASTAVDASGTIYLSYSAIVENLISVTNTSKVVRHVYIMKSTDGGATWTNPCDIVPNDPSTPYEGVFCSMAKRIDGNVHLLYQRDYTPGYGVPPSSGTNPDADNVDQINDLVYYKISTADVGVACAVTDVGVHENNSSVSTLNAYPNPAANAATIEVSLKQNSKLDITIMNNMGQVVYTTHVDGTSGVNKVDVNLNNLSSGVYFYTVTAENSKPVSKKLVIQK
ncbi:MAG: T9SS type A sorting domain-containing protein [Bacteroidetes bacterium]|nr:T9SS type A sorting domain-containing protein [Bacteroidota bacterium]